MSTPEICGAQHPHEPLTCQLAPGPNAVSDVPPKVPATATADEVAALSQAPTRQVEVHVHKGLDRDGGTHRWEDAPEDSSE